MTTPGTRQSSPVVPRPRGLQRALLLAGLAVVTAVACAQTPAPEPLPQDVPPPPTAGSTLSVSVRLVSIDAVVRNKKTGDLVTDLDKDAFTLREDNKPVAIKYFNRDNDLPLTLGLLVDTSGSQRDFFDDEALASDNFLRNTLLQPNDRAFLVRFDSNILLLQKMTSSLSQLHSALRLLDYKPSTNITASSHGGTLLFDAIATVSANVIGKEQGRRALVIMTDGDDNGSRLSLDSAIRQAQLANVAIYSVLYTNEAFSNGARYPPSSSRPSGIDIMTQISKATGGRAFIVGTGTPVKQIFAAIAEDLRTQYRLGFTPAESKPGQTHKLELRATDKNLNVQARTAYVSPER